MATVEEKPSISHSYNETVLRRRLWQYWKTQVVTLSSYLHFENSRQSRTGWWTTTAHVISFFLPSLFTSAISGKPCSMGQNSQGFCKNSKLFNHLPCTLPLEIPFVKSSATLNKVEQWNQSLGSVTVQETKGLKRRSSLDPGQGDVAVWQVAHSFKVEPGFL